MRGMKLLSESEKRELGELARRNMESMAFPASDWEASTLAEVLTFPRVFVTRPPDHELITAEMVPYHCHSNCAAQQANDTEGRSRHVSGWIVYGVDLVLHSVVRIDGEWFCMTPQLVPTPSRFQFIPDPLIEWRLSSDGDFNVPYRRGVALPDALRKYPEEHIRAWNHFRQLLAKGVSAFDAREDTALKLGADFRAKGIL